MVKQQQRHATGTPKGGSLTTTTKANTKTKNKAKRLDKKSGKVKSASSKHTSDKKEEQDGAQRRMGNGARLRHLRTEFRRYNAPNAIGNRQPLARMRNFVKQVAMHMSSAEEGETKATIQIGDNTLDSFCDALNSYTECILTHANDISRIKGKDRSTVGPEEITQAIHWLRSQNVGPQWDESTLNYTINKS